MNIHLLTYALNYSEVKQKANVLWNYCSFKVKQLPNSLFVTKRLN